MIYKSNQEVISKEIFLENNIIYKTLTINPLENAIITGNIRTLTGKYLYNATVVLMEYNRDGSSIYEEIEITKADKQGNYYFSIIPKENKLYSVAVYSTL